MKYILTLLIFLTVNTHAASWVSSTGTVKVLATYAHTETIIVEISDDDIGVGTCSNKKAFAISDSMSPEGRARMYSMLLAAQASGRKVTLSYLNEGGCESWFSTHDVYRKITIAK